MEISAYLHHFENSMTSYTGDDPLEQWEKFVDYLEQRLPADGRPGMSTVFDTLVQRFLNVERYANDIRYVNYCIKCASFYSDPVAMYSHIFSKGVGMKTAALYVSWAKQFEQKGLNDQADAVYQKALANRAEPGDALLHEYRQFQTRTRCESLGLGVQTPLQNSSLLNQISSHPASQHKAPVDVPSKPPAVRTVITVSRSETSEVIRSAQASNVQMVSQYDKDALQCEGSELCFEEVRAAKYFVKRLEEKEEVPTQMVNKTPSKVIRSRHCVLAFNQQSGDELKPGAQAFSVETAIPSLPTFWRPEPTERPRHSVGLRLHTEPSPLSPPAAAAPSYFQHSDPNAGSTVASHQLSVVQSSQCRVDVEPQTTVLSTTEENSRTHQDVAQPLENEERLDASQSGTANLSHVTPNTSLGYVQATPSRVLPSPTVNTREALGVILDMFQAPTFLEEPFSNATMLHATQREESEAGKGNISVVTTLPTKAAFTIFQDEKENHSAAPPPVPTKPKPIRALCDITATKTDKPNDTPSDLMSDESTVWGARYISRHSLAACPNSTSDFDMLAQCVSTPCANKDFFISHMFQEGEINCGAEAGAFVARPGKKLSPIIEQSPNDEKPVSAVSQLLPSPARQGTIVGEAFLTSSSSITIMQPPPPAVLSFREQTLCSTESSRPGWEVYTSPSPQKPAAANFIRPQSESFKIPEESERCPSPGTDVPMSPECPPKLSWMTIRSPEAPVDSDMVAFMSPRPLKMSDASSVRGLEVPMSPDRPPPVDPMDASMMSPDTCSREASVNSARTGVIQLVSDPWDSDLISGLLSTLSPPLTAHPCCVSWQCRTPHIAPKMTLSMGERSLRVDGVVGNGAFATVYQVTDPVTSDRMVLKVQKPANPWEFYINTQLDKRLRPDERRLYSNMRSAHLFLDGSVLLGDLHSHGTLLNAVNIYRTLSDKVMPQPLVLYLAVCMLHMVERLHAAGIVHADIKPDNFLLGEKFLENKCFDPEVADHGLVLIDLGQSIDMQLFPQGTAFTARCLTSGFQCVEMLSGKPWNYQTDYFGLAGTVHCLLFGTYMEVTNNGGVWRTNGMFRRNPHSELWQHFFHLLLNVQDCSSLPDLAELQLQLTAVLQQNYSSKLPTLKSRLVVLLLENRKTARR